MTAHARIDDRKVIPDEMPDMPPERLRRDKKRPFQRIRSMKRDGRIAIESEVQREPEKIVSAINFP